MSYKAKFTWIVAVLATFQTITGFSFPGTALPNSNKMSASVAAIVITPLSVIADEAAVSSWYNMLHLDSLGMDQRVFAQAVKGWNKLRSHNRISRENILTIADFSQPSINKRLYVIDLDAGRVLYHTYVAHGRNTGKDKALSYSNRMSSYKSSPGFYLTSTTYNGSNGYSLRLTGLEKGINDNAQRRAIVMHGADYVNESYISSQGYIGRSQGCPAIPLELTMPVINTIKEGSCLFIYTASPSYTSRSTLLR
jgi:hypothetical protein